MMRRAWVLLILGVVSAGVLQLAACGGDNAGTGPVADGSMSDDATMDAKDVVTDVARGDSPADVAMKADVAQDAADAALDAVADVTDASDVAVSSDAGDAGFDAADTGDANDADQAIDTGGANDARDANDAGDASDAAETSACSPDNCSAGTCCNGVCIDSCATCPAAGVFCPWSPGRGFNSPGGSCVADCSQCVTKNGVTAKTKCLSCGLGKPAEICATAPGQCPANVNASACTCALGDAGDTGDAGSCPGTSQVCAPGIGAQPGDSPVCLLCGQTGTDGNACNNGKTCVETTGVCGP